MAIEDSIVRQLVQEVSKEDATSSDRRVGNRSIYHKVHSREELDANYAQEMEQLEVLFSEYRSYRAGADVEDEGGNEQLAEVLDFAAMLKGNNEEEQEQMYVLMRKMLKDVRDPESGFARSSELYEERNGQAELTTNGVEVVTALDTGMNLLYENITGEELDPDFNDIGVKTAAGWLTLRGRFGEAAKILFVPDKIRPSEDIVRRVNLERRVESEDQLAEKRNLLRAEIEMREIEERRETGEEFKKEHENVQDRLQGSIQSYESGLNLVVGEARTVHVPDGGLFEDAFDQIVVERGQMEEQAQEEIRALAQVSEIWTNADDETKESIAQWMRECKKQVAEWEKHAGQFISTDVESELAKLEEEEEEIQNEGIGELSKDSRRRLIALREIRDRARDEGVEMNEYDAYGHEVVNNLTNRAVDEGWIGFGTDYSTANLETLIYELSFDDDKGYGHSVEGEIYPATAHFVDSIILYDKTRNIDSLTVLHESMHSEDLEGIPPSVHESLTQRVDVLHDIEVEDIWLEAHLASQVDAFVGEKLAEQHQISSPEERQNIRGQVEARLRTLEQYENERDDGLSEEELAERVRLQRRIMAINGINQVNPKMMAEAAREQSPTVARVEELFNNTIDDGMIYRLLAEQYGVRQDADNLREQVDQRLQQQGGAGFLSVLVNALRTEFARVSAATKSEQAVKNKRSNKAKQRGQRRQ